MNDKNAIIEKVNKIINAYSDRRIVLYGTGNVSRWIVDDAKIKGYKIDEIIDLNFAESFFCGYKVITKKDFYRVSSNDLIIVMNRNPVIAQFIYNRIFKLLPHGAIVLWIDGSSFEYKEDNKLLEIENNKISIEEIKKKIDSFEVVSFDIFDTLLVRCVEKTTDIFKLLDERVKIKYGIDGFSELRKEAEINANKIYKSPTLEEIYFQFCEQNGLKDKSAAISLKNEEIEAEKRVLSIRNSVCELINYCNNNNKSIFLISDTYYSLDEIVCFFEINGINILKMIDKKNILLSCELRKSKDYGDLWQYYSQLVDVSKCLHIGDNEICDLQLSKKVGIDSVLIGSPLQLRNALDLGTICNSCNPLTSVGLGKFNSYVLNSPFSGEVEIRTHFDYGYSILGPIIFNYLYWILRQEDNENNKRLYFFSRDGYFLVELFNQMARDLDKKIVGTYLYSSRALMKYLCYKPGENEKTGFIGTLKDYLKYRFNYLLSDDGFNEKFVDANDDADDVLGPYLSRIIEKQKRSCKLYDDYLNSLGINKANERICIVDPTYNGTSQYYLSKYADVKSKGYYCVANLSENNRYNSEYSQMKAFYQNEDDKKADNSLINKYTLVFESSIMVSPEGSVIDISDEGFVFTPTGKTQECFSFKEETYKGIALYFKEMCQMIRHFYLYDYEPDNLFPQIIFSLCIEGKIKVSDQIKQSLFADDYYNQITDYSVAWQ